mgnify:CR=1 FL=1|jgi:hypothetical protein
MKRYRTAYSGPTSLNLLALAALVLAAILGLVWWWHLLAPESWRWLNADQLGDIESAGIGLMAAGAALHALPQVTGRPSK